MIYGINILVTDVTQKIIKNQITNKFFVCDYSNLLDKVSFILKSLLIK